LPHGITQCYLPPDTVNAPRLTRAKLANRPTREGWKAELTYR